MGWKQDGGINRLTTADEHGKGNPSDIDRET